jgi:hypothetical protein
MANILLAYRVDHHEGIPVPTYSLCFHRELENLGHDVFPVGEGHPNRSIKDMSDYLINQNDLFIDLDCGRNRKGDHHFQNTPDIKIRIPTAVWFIDSHGNPTLHHRLGKRYNHVFFAVYNKRDIFANYPSAHFLPSASDLKYFNYLEHQDIHSKPKYVAGFFGSRHGLHRADILKEVCEKNKWSYDIREVSRQYKHRWPRTAKAMCDCRILFNRGQKHDINQRIFESMLCNRPLLMNRDPLSGLSLLFKEGDHYLGYNGRSGEETTEIALQIIWCRDNADLAKDMAQRAYNLVKKKHLISHRVKKILEVCNVG